MYCKNKDYASFVKLKNNLFSKYVANLTEIIKFEASYCKMGYQ